MELRHSDIIRLDLEACLPFACASTHSVLLAKIHTNDLHEATDDGKSHGDEEETRATILTGGLV